MPMKEMCAMFTCPVASCRRRLMVRSRFMATVVATSRWYESCVSQGSATPARARSASVTRGRTAVLRATDQSARPQHQDGDLGLVRRGEREPFVTDARLAFSIG